MIEEYPPAPHNPHKDSVSDVSATLNMNLAKRTTQLAAIALCTLAGVQSKVPVDLEE
jgi:hypothetical protein